MSKNGRSTQNYRRHDNDDVVHTFPNSSVRYSKRGNFTRKEFSDGRVFDYKKRVDEKTGNSIYTRRGSRTRYVYRNVEVRGRPVEVYVNHSNGVLSNPWFWMYLNQRSANNNYVSPYPHPSGSIRAPSAPPSVSESWGRTYRGLPKKYRERRTYTDVLDWATDYVTLGIINENVPDRGWISTHLCWLHSCADTGQDYDIDVQTRALFKKQVGQTLVDLKEQKDVSLIKSFGESGLEPAAKDYLLVADQTEDVRRTDDQSRCLLQPGAILGLDAYHSESATVDATIRIAGGDEGDACPAGKQINLDATVAQRYQNQFLGQVDNAITRADRYFEAGRPRR